MEDFVFDGVNKKIVVNINGNKLNVLKLYSNWKRWACNLDNLKFSAPFESDSKPDITGKIIHIIYIINNWELIVLNSQHQNLEITDGFLFKK